MGGFYSTITREEREMATLGIAIVLAGVGVVALACIGLWHVTEPQETIAAKRTYSHNGAIRFQRIARR